MKSIWSLLCALRFVLSAHRLAPPAQGKAAESLGNETLRYRLPATGSAGGGVGVSLLLLFLCGGLVGGDDLIGDRLRDDFVVRVLHRVGPTPLGHGGEVRRT